MKEANMTSFETRYRVNPQGMIVEEISIQDTDEFDEEDQSPGHPMLKQRGTTQKKLEA